jgi:hypothetical protein
MGTSDFDWITIEDVEVKTETDKALLCTFSDGKEVWIPKSQVGVDSEAYAPGMSGTLVVPRWLAEKDELE